MRKGIKGKGILLFSGGLDSILAAKVLMEQDLELTGLFIVLPFTAPDLDLTTTDTAIRAKDIGLPLIFHRCGIDYLDMFKEPPHGYGKNMNPCIDCKIYFMNKAAELMRKTGSDFVATGEVVGQRPMSQIRHTMNHLEKSSGLKGRLVRPLSAGLLKPSIPEQEGIIDRERLYSINGRSRRIQMELAEKYGITGYSSPAGGCLFTDPAFSARARDLVMHHDRVTPEDIFLLTIGRHFRLHDRAKIIVSRNESENIELDKYAEMADIFFRPAFKGPLAYSMGDLDENDIIQAGRIIARYSKPDQGTRVITVQRKSCAVKEIRAEDPLPDDIIADLRI